MTTWYAHRRDDGTIASIHQEPQEGYAEEMLVEGESADLDEFIARTSNPVPPLASAGSFMRACVRLDRYDAIVAFVEAMEGPEGKEMRALLKHAVEYRRTSPSLIAVAHAIGMTDADIDAVFVLAAQLDKEEE